MMNKPFYKYLKLKYFIFFVKLVFLKAKYRTKFITAGIKYGFERGFILRIEENGEVILGKQVYFARRTDVMAIGGILTIGDNVSFNKDCTVVSRIAITIGDNCKFGEAVSIYDHNHNLSDFNRPISEQGFSSKPIEIGSNVLVGSKVFVKSGVKIGNNVIIGANSVITKDVPSGMIAFGNPAKYRPNPRLCSRSMK